MFLPLNESDNRRFEEEVNDENSGRHNSGQEFRAEEVGDVFRTQIGLVDDKLSRDASAETVDQC